MYNDKVRMYKEIMTNDDNLESNLLTSSLLKMLVIKFAVADPGFPVGGGGVYPLGGGMDLRRGHFERK